MSLHTFDELSDEELDRMERRVAAATIGPWLPEDDEAELTANVSIIELGLCNELGTFKSIELIGASAADHEFIVNARQDMPRLLQEVRALRARLHSLNASLDDLEPHMRSAGEEAFLLSPSM
jgi:hypothetical protein